MSLDSCKASHDKMTKFQFLLDGKSDKYLDSIHSLVLWMWNFASSFHVSVYYFMFEVFLTVVQFDKQKT